jgi:glycosyltransferase involved in cell wall biosynthesis
MCALGQNLGLGDSVTWLGRRSDVAALCEAADVLAMPSDWPELFGRTLIEAMSCGTPAVGTRVGGVPEVLSGEFARWIVPPVDPRSLADALVDVYHHRSTDADLPRRCREWVIRNFNIQGTISGVEASLLRALARGRRRVSVSTSKAMTSEAKN